MSDDDVYDLIDITEEFNSAPSAECGRCHRHTWATSEFGQEDRMPQPDGFPCGGRFSDPSAPGGDTPVDPA